MEEFGVTNTNQTTTYDAWLNTGLIGGLPTRFGALVARRQFAPSEMVGVYMALALKEGL
ncbi:hypothetical protein FRB93_013613 [Tulasnella sp. JGI-2019a]|nr:hypothetical protein FRB93_013613 [Tulasnella sp. JGI-2019a]